MEESIDNQLDSVDPCVLNLLFGISNIIYRVETYCYDVYSCNYFLKGMIDNILYLTKWTCNSLQNKRTEPNEMVWGSSCRILEGGLFETFVYENNYPIILECGDFVIYRNYDYILCSQTGLIQIDCDKILSDIRFLSIEYNHPEMPEPIQLVLEKEWCIVGNEVLGKIHILRMLAYQALNHQYIFDDRYTLKIIDSNINILEIRENQYIRLEKEGYIVL